MAIDASTADLRASAATARRSRAFQIGFTLCIINTIIGAAQPVITRWGAVNLDPLLFCTGAVVFATICTIPLLYFSGELKLIINPRYRARLFVMSMTGNRDDESHAHLRT